MRNRTVGIILLLSACGPAKPIEMPYTPLPAPEPGTGPVDVIRDMEAPGKLPPLHTVRLPDGDAEYRFGVVGHMALGGTNTIIRATRSGGVARGEVWCHRLAWELKDSLGRTPHQVARTIIEREPDWNGVLDSIAAIGLMRYAEKVPLVDSGKFVPRSQTDQPSILFEGREGGVYRSLEIYGRTPEDRPEWPRVRGVIRAVWGEQRFACGELNPDAGEWDPHSTTKWIIRPDSGRRP